MGGRAPGVVGIDAKADSSPTLVVPGPLGVTMTARLIAQVNDDWHPPSPNTTPTISLTADTLEDLAKMLPSNEWGQGGGGLRSERILPGNSTNLTVQLHGNLILRLPEWTNASSATAKARAEWDRMVNKLREHEQRHVDIAIEEFDKVGPALIGKDIDKIVDMVTAANAAAQKRQDELDTATDHGAKKGVQYGDVYLDTSIT